MGPDPNRIAGYAYLGLELPQAILDICFQSNFRDLGENFTQAARQIAAFYIRDTCELEALIDEYNALQAKPGRSSRKRVKPTKRNFESLAAAELKSKHGRTDYNRSMIVECWDRACGECVLTRFQYLVFGVAVQAQQQIFKYSNEAWAAYKDLLHNLENASKVVNDAQVTAIKNMEEIIRKRNRLAMTAAR